jgi:Fe-S-cluster containining protein
MQVPVTIFDLIGAAVHKDKPLGTIYDESYFIGVLPLEGFDGIKSVAIKLRKPCPFLGGQGCSIYEVRPLACILFPECQAVNGTIKTLAVQTEYRDYSCLCSPFSVPRERARAIRTLAGMLQREVLVSDSYLFGRSPFWVDFSGVMEDFLQDSGEQPPWATHDDSQPSDVIPFEAFDRIFKRTFLQCPPFSRLDALIRDLDDHERTKAMFARLSNKELLADLAHAAEDRPLVFSYRRGVLEARRRSLIPREHMFL